MECGHELTNDPRYKEVERLRATGKPEDRKEALIIVNQIREDLGLNGEDHV